MSDEYEPTCGCLLRFNEALADENTAVDTVVWMNLDTGIRRITVRIPTYKLDSRSRKRAVPVVAEFCPFCGTRYPTGEKPDTTPPAPSAAPLDGRTEPLSVHGTGPTR